MKVLQLTLLCLCAFLISSAFGTKIKRPVKPCIHRGRIYAVGSAFYDGCNLCICSTSRRISCTKKLCFTPVDCRWNPCVNGGKCECVGFGKYKCKCPKEVYGDYCEKDPCDPSPCKGINTVCISMGFGGYCCKDRCNPNPCLWYETCIPRKYDGYMCHDPCKPNPCKFGKCYPLGHGKYQCQGCVYCGKVYRIHENFRIKCDVCYCHGNGMVTCTRRCGTCSYKGKLYRSGSIIRIKCNTCHCLNGGWACTTSDCLGVPFRGV